MRARRGLTLAIAVLLALPLAGCLENMGDVKTALGFTSEPPPRPDPVPPVAVARANLTLTTVGAPVLFTSAGSSDPDGLVTAYEWDFGDGNASTEPVAAHAFTRAGEFTVRLVVTDDAGLTAEDFVTVTVRAANAPPQASLVVKDARGRAVSSGDAGDPLTFDAAGARDADGDALRIEWDFGDGTTGVGETVRHAYARPGTYLVRVTVADVAGASASASRLVAQNLNASWAGESFPPASDKGASRAFTLPVPDAAGRVDVTLRYDGEWGTTDLALEVRNARGAVVASARDADSRLGAAGMRTETLTLTADILREHAGGDWQLVVTKAKGVRVTFDLTARVVA